MKKYAKIGTFDVLLEAEVAPAGQAGFEQRYLDATGQNVDPGNPVHYQSQANKWGAELRIYFNDAAMATALAAMGLHVEFPRKGYNSGQYAFRANNNDLWWSLVEKYDFRLGEN